MMSFLADLYGTVCPEAFQHLGALFGLSQRPATRVIEMVTTSLLGELQVRLRHPGMRETLLARLDDLAFTPDLPATAYREDPTRLHLLNHLIGARVAELARQLSAATPLTKHEAIQAVLVVALLVLIYLKRMTRTAGGARTALAPILDASAPDLDPLARRALEHVTSQE